jgi:hypothetical protein
VLRYNIPKEEAIKDKSFLSEWKLKRFGSIVKENWRVCTHCKEFKERDKFAKSRTWYNWTLVIVKNAEIKWKLIIEWELITLKIMNISWIKET